jgi:ABC-type transporter Mla MlaB component
MDPLGSDLLTVHVFSGELNRDSFQDLATSRSAAIARIRCMTLALDRELLVGGQSVLRSLGNFTSLRRLKLCWRRPIRQTDAEWWIGVESCLAALAIAAPKLIALDVTCERARDITSSGLACLAPLKLLQELRLYYSNERQQGPDHALVDGLVHLMPQLTALRHLSVGSSSAIDAAALEALHAAGALATLQSIDLSGCPYVDDACLAVIAQLANLQALRVHGCTAITDAGLQALAPLGALQELGLNGLPLITDNGLIALAPLTALQYLSVSWCRGIRHECHETLRNERPGLRLRCDSSSCHVPEYCPKRLSVRGRRLPGCDCTTGKSAPNTTADSSELL